MGNKHEKPSKFDTKNTKTSFSEQSLLQIRQNCYKLFNIPYDKQNPKQQEQTLLQQKFSPEHFKNQIFLNDPILGQNIFEWMSSLRPQQPYTDVLIFIDACEYLVNDPFQYQFTEFNNKQLESLEIFICLCLKLNWKTFSTMNKINKQQGAQIIEHIFLMFGEKDEKLVESIIKNIFDDIEEQDISSFIFKIKSKMTYINRFIKDYFNLKLIKLQNVLPITEIDNESYILSKANICLFNLNGIGLKKNVKFQLLYSTNTSGTSFNRLNHQLLGYNAPTIILLQHSEKNKDGTRTNHVFGGYNSSEWEEKLSYQGSSDNYIFSLYPQHKNYYVYNGEGGTNYCYINAKFIENSKYKPGLGFGGNESLTKFRLWVDDDIISNSYTLPEDKAYANGYLFDPMIEKLNVHTLEVWGIGNDDNLEHQAKYRIEKQKQLQKMRKVDKKMMFEGALGDMFIPGLTKHKDQLRENIEREDMFSEDEGEEEQKQRKQQEGF